MKGLKCCLVIVAAALLTMGVSGMASAFHSGGVAECSGCHTMHGSTTTTVNNVTTTKYGTGALGDHLLVGTDASSTCLTCHENASAGSYHISTPGSVGTTMLPINRTPGGDFGWLKRNFTFTGESGGAETEYGYTHGHSIVAQDYGYDPDPVFVTAPGGTFSSSQLGCQSCHDPHGRTRRLDNGTYVRPTPGTTAAPIIGSGSYATSTAPAAGQAVGVYRILRGMGDTYNGATFSGVAIAVAPGSYNAVITTNSSGVASGATEATKQVRVAYGQAGANTWGNWCASCHPDMLGGKSAHKHPVDEALGNTIATNYNAYKWSGDLGGNAASSFTSLIPFVEATGTIATLQSHAKADNTYLNGPTSSDAVSCFSCHRAHAGGWEKGLRWYTEYEFITKNGQYVASDNLAVTGNRAGVQHRGRDIATAQAAYYDRPAATFFASYQRQLCNKCHVQD